MRGALDDIRVLDLSRVLAGPYCTMTLADLGADIIKVEQPHTGDDTRRWGPPFDGGESAYYLSANRNKRSITLNLKSPRGQEVLRALARGSDVVVENFRVGALDALGIGYEELRAENRGLIWCSITGYGTSGPYADRAGYDFVVQGESGIMSITGAPEGEPTKVGVAIVDVTTGLFAANAILAALHARERNGHGQQIDIPLLSSAVAWLVNVGSSYLMTGATPVRHGNAHPSIVPYQPFEASDGWMTVAVGNDAQFRALCAELGRPDLADDPRFSTNAARVAHRETLLPILQSVFKREPVARWRTALTGAGIPCGPINTVPQALAHPQIQYRDMIKELPHPTAGSVRMVGPPYMLSQTPTEVRTAPPLLGQHTEEVIRERLGLSQTEIDALREDGVI